MVCDSSLPIFQLIIMGTFYNRQDMSAPCSPVTVGDEFNFKRKNCRITKINEDASFNYVFINPALNDGKTRKITFKYWQNNIKINKMRYFLK